MRRARPHAARTSRPDPARTARSLSASVWLQTGSTSTPLPERVGHELLRRSELTLRHVLTGGVPSRRPNSEHAPAFTQRRRRLSPLPNAPRYAACADTNKL